MKNCSVKFVLLILFLSISLNAECKPKEDIDITKKDSLNLFNKSKSLYANEKYSESYDTLNESFKLFADNNSNLLIYETCYKLVSGPFAPKKQEYIAEKEYDFNRVAFGSKIKAYLSPKPLVVIQFIEDSTMVIPIIKQKDNLKVIATITNVKSTKRESVKGQLPLEDFFMYIDNEKVDFPTIIASGEQVEKTFLNQASYKNFSFSTSERYGYKTFSKDW